MCFIFLPKNLACKGLLIFVTRSQWVERVSIFWIVFFSYKTWMAIIQTTISIDELKEIIWFNSFEGTNDALSTKHMGQLTNVICNLCWYTKIRTIYSTVKNHYRRSARLYNFFANFKNNSLWTSQRTIDGYPKSCYFFYLCCHLLVDWHTPT